jgi:dCTP deaminase
MADGGVLTGPEIEYQCKRGNIVIDPFNQEQVNPASYDLRLGSKVAVYRACVVRSLTKIDPNQVAQEGNIVAETTGEGLYPWSDVMDSKQPQGVLEFEMNPDRGWLLKPGVGYLMHTAERVRTDKYVPVLDGKSSIGRLFIAVHVTAGYGDTGFDGQYTLEVVATHPVIVYPGMRFCQIRFHTAVGDVLPYRGNYTGDASMGPVPSRAYNQFK